MGHWVKEADQQMRSFWAATAVKAATGFFVLAWAAPEPDQQAALRGVPLPSDSPYGSLVAAWVRKLNCFFLRVLFFACFRGRGLGDDPTQTLESAPRQTGKEEVWKQRWTVGHWHQHMGLDKLFSCSCCIYYLRNQPQIRPIMPGQIPVHALPWNSLWNRCGQQALPPSLCLYIYIWI